MTKKIIISLSVIAAIAFGFLYGKGLLSVHQGLEPPIEQLFYRMQCALIN